MQRNRECKPQKSQSKQKQPGIAATNHLACLSKNTQKLFDRRNKKASKTSPNVSKLRETFPSARDLFCQKRCAHNERAQTTHPKSDHFVTKSKYTDVIETTNSIEHL